jgi:hypothetical protein
MQAVVRDVPRGVEAIGGTSPLVPSLWRETEPSPLDDRSHRSREPDAADCTLPLRFFRGVRESSLLDESSHGEHETVNSVSPPLLFLGVAERSVRGSDSPPRSREADDAVDGNLRAPLSIRSLHGDNSRRSRDPKATSPMLCLFRGDTELSLLGDSRELEAPAEVSPRFRGVKEPSPLGGSLH